MSTAQGALGIARRELGTVESPANSNRTKYGKWYGMDGQPWCAMFTSWVFAQAGLERSDLTHFAYTPAGANAYRKAGRFHAKPQPGDLAFFDFPGDRKRRIQHIGIVESATATTVTCIEGNTSPGRAGSQDNGGGVYRRTRPRSHIVGYGRPPYATKVQAASDQPITPAPPPPTPEEDDDMRRGDTGGDVAKLQTRLNQVGYRDDAGQSLTADGDYGQATAQAIARFQKYEGLTVNGERVSAMAIAHLQALAHGKTAHA